MKDPGKDVYLERYELCLIQMALGLREEVMSNVIDHSDRSQSKRLQEIVTLRCKIISEIRKTEEIFYKDRKPGDNV